MAVSVHVLAGDGGRALARSLAADARVRLTASPRHAHVLAVLGAIPTELHDEARRVHDQIAAPRATVWMGGEGAPFHDAERMPSDADLGLALVRAHRALQAGDRPSEPPLGAATHPVAWEGRGPHGQGGEGMMGGTPYGRRMAMTDDDLRDGLSLDHVPVRLGPFLSWMPPGFSIALKLQGDVVEEASIEAHGFAQRDDDVFTRATRAAVGLADLEVARARHLLHATADMLSLHDLPALALRARTLADGAGVEDERAVRRLARLVSRIGSLRLALGGVGRIDEQRASRLGTVGRASGAAEDARGDDPAYQALGFTPITRDGGDALARFFQRLDEAAQALALARRAGDAVRERGGQVERPEGPLAGIAARKWLRVVEETAPGQSFDAFATTVVSLDLDGTVIPRGTDG